MEETSAQQAGQGTGAVDDIYSAHYYVEEEEHDDDLWVVVIS